MYVGGWEGSFELVGRRFGREAEFAEVLDPCVLLELRLGLNLLIKGISLVTIFRDISLPFVA